MVSRDELAVYMNTLLASERFKDYGPNGLQVQGKEKITRIVSGVTASLALIQQAVTLKADAIIVHHGLFWRNQDGRITGWMHNRVKTLLINDINLFAYHLPLDAAPKIGNNAMLAKQLGLKPTLFTGEQGLLVLGHPLRVKTMRLETLVERVQAKLQRTPTVIPGDGRLLRCIAWCSGGAQGSFEAAIAAGADAYITGEISEPQAHYARETGVAYLACGHHATERFGVQALAQHVAKRFALKHQYIEIDNPA